MKLKHPGKQLISLALTSALSLSVLPLTASADWQHIGCMGDLDRDQKVTLTDLVRLTKHILAVEPLKQEHFYEVKGATIGINGADGFQAGEYLNTADINEDGEVDVFDLALLKRYVLAGDGPWVWQWMDETTPEIPDTPDEPETTESPETPVDTTGLGNFISPPIQAVKGFLPSQGNAGLVILYVDFPDCPYDYAPSMEELESIAFGPENTSHEHYPFESASAYFERAFKGSMHLYGKAFRYTAQNNNDAYNGVPGRQSLLREALKAFDEAEDFSQYDGDNDGFIDTVLLFVPKAAGDDNWWPCAGPLDDENFFVDGKKVGHIITGNAQVESPTNYIVFNETILHEMGHCMGLPDYYLYHGEDTTGLHGAAGGELMDDGYADFGCVSKLQYGWYREKQIEVFDSSKTTETYTLHNAQTDAGNVLVIPCGELDGQYHSEYMLVEYMTEDRNNSHPGWWMLTGSGIRVYHVDATIKEDYWGPSFMYGSGAPVTNNDEGRRLLRVIDDRNVDNIYRTGDVIDGNISGFHWYDKNGGQTVDTGVMIQVGELTENGYEITVTRNS